MSLASLDGGHKVVACATVFDVSLLDRQRARFGVDAQSGRPTAYLGAVAVALGGAFTSLLGAVFEGVTAETLASVLDPRNLLAQVVAALDAVGGSDALTRHGAGVPFEFVIQRTVGVDEVGVAAYGFPVAGSAFDG